MGAQPAVEEVIIPAAPIKKGGPNNLLAMGTVVSERVVTPEELFQDGRFFEAEAERAPAPVAYTPAPTIVQAAPVVYEQAPIIEYVEAAPVVYETMQPQMIEYAQAAPVMAAPVIYR